MDWVQYSLQLSSLITTLSAVRWSKQYLCLCLSFLTFGQLDLELRSASCPMVSVLIMMRTKLKVIFLSMLWTFLCWWCAVKKLVTHLLSPDVHVFRTNNVRFPLYLVMVQDSHGHGQVVAFAFAKNNKEVYIHRLFEAFQPANVEACSKVQVVLINKDFMERQTVSRMLPQASLHLCIFHLLRAFSHGIAECNLKN